MILKPKTLETLNPRSSKTDPKPHPKLSKPTALNPKQMARFSGGWPLLVRPLVDDVSVFFAVPHPDCKRGRCLFVCVCVGGSPLCLLFLNLFLSDIVACDLKSSRAWGVVFFCVIFRCLIYVVAVVFAALRLITALMVRSTMQLGFKSSDHTTRQDVVQFVESVFGMPRFLYY